MPAGNCELVLGNGSIGFTPEPRGGFGLWIRCGSGKMGHFDVQTCSVHLSVSYEHGHG